MSTTFESTRDDSNIHIWLVSVFFVLFQFFLQLSSGVVIDAIVQEQHLTAWMAGLLSSVFYVVYTALQLPVGILFDQKNTRKLLASTALLCSIGCFIFAHAQDMSMLFLGRFIIGAGASFAFIGLSHVLRQYYPIRQFAFLIGLSETLGFMVTVFGLLILGALISSTGWRHILIITGFIGLMISSLCWSIIPKESTPTPSNPNYRQEIMHILGNKQAWLNGFFVGLCFIVVTTFGGLWAIPFLQIKLNCGLQEASALNACFFVGTAIGCPLFGWLSVRCKKRNPLILASCLSTAFLILLLLYVPIQNTTLAGCMMICIGVCCGAYMLAYSIANELAPKDYPSTCTGFTNMLAVITTPILQSLIGYLLEAHHNRHTYTLFDYQYALLIIPGSLLLACTLVRCLPEKT